MKILFVSDTYYPHLNGVYYFVCRIGPLLQEKGHQVTVIAPSETPWFTEKEIDNLRVFGIPSLPVLIYPKVRVTIPFLLKSRLHKLIATINPDVIHLQDHFVISNAAIEVARKLRIPVIGTNHFMPENLTSLVRSEFWKKRMEKMLWSNFSKVYNKVPIITTPTETGARLIRPKLNVRVVAISSGINLNEFNPFGDGHQVSLKYNIPDKPVLLFVGRLDPEKHIDKILEALAKIDKKIDFCFVIVGKGLRRKELEEQAKELGIINNVVFTGFVPEDDLPYLYKLSRCFIIASTAELLSLGVLQAMASGLPVIAANAGALPELIEEKANGYLFNPNDQKKLVQSIVSILIDADMSRRMGYKSLEKVAAHALDYTVETFEKLYKSQLPSKAINTHFA